MEKSWLQALKEILVFYCDFKSFMAGAIGHNAKFSKSK
jgi:hypothetical protein